MSDLRRSGSLGRVLVAGNGQAAGEILTALTRSGACEAILGIAPPGEGMRHGWQPALSTTARELGVRVLQPIAVRGDDVFAEVQEFRPTLLLSVCYTQIFDDRLLGAVDGPSLNFHPSLLPRHRGVAPLIWAIAEGDTRTGVTVHHLDAGIDTGEVVVQRPLAIHPLDTGYRLHQKASRLMVGIGLDLIRRLIAGDPLPAGSPQSGTASEHRRSDPQLNHITWTDGAERIRNIVRALAPPLPGAFFMVRSAHVLLEGVRAELRPRRSRHGMLGSIELFDDGTPAVQVVDGSVVVERMLIDGRSVSGAEGFELLGLRSGDVLS